MIAAIVVPGGIRSMSKIRACLVLGPAADLADAGSDCLRGAGLTVLRAIERVVAFGLVLDLVIGSPEVYATPSAAPPRPRPGQNSRQGKTPKPASAVPSRQQQRSDQGRKPVISEQIVTEGPKILPSVPWVRIALSPPVKSKTQGFSTTGVRARGGQHDPKVFINECEGLYLAYIQPEAVLPKGRRQSGWSNARSEMCGTNEAIQDSPSIVRIWQNRLNHVSRR
jgi:hypothetical protein